MNLMEHCPKCGNDLIVKGSQTLVTGRAGYKCVTCGWRRVLK